MNIISKSMRAATALLAIPLLLVSLSASSQEQVLAEVGVVGELSSGDQGVIRPDFAAKEMPLVDYTDWVASAEGRDFKAMAISPKGTVLILNGTTIEEYNSSGVVQDGAGSDYPVDCTAITFDITKKNGRPGTDQLSNCNAFTPLNDGTIRIAGTTNGGGFVIIGYDPATELATLRADGTPPSITDMDGDEFADAIDDRLGPGYYAVGDRKKVIFFPLAAEDQFEVIATLNGVRIDSVTPFGPHIIVALESGELRYIDPATGVATSFATATDCGLGRKDPQQFSVRGDPSGNLFVSNQGCSEIRIYDDSLQLVNPMTNETLGAEPFLLTSPQDFFPTGLDWQSGQSGDFNDDCDEPTQELGCEFGATANQAVMWEVETILESDTSYRMFQFVDLVDCRWTGDRPCPIINCPLADMTNVHGAGCPLPEEEQVLDLAQVLIRADVTGDFQSAAWGAGPVDVMAIPAYLRAEECFPGIGAQGVCEAGEVENDFRFYSFFAVTDAIFTGTFFVDYQVDEFRTGSLDPCIIPPAESLIPAINETANIILYNSGNGFGTVDRLGVEGTRGGSIGNSFCNGGATRARWSANTIGLELYDDSDIAYVTQVERMMDELVQTKMELVCSAFFDPNGVPMNLDLGPLLLGSDCSSIENSLDQVEQKLGVCIDSLFSSQQGNSAENCNAFFTKIANLKGTLDAAAWPSPLNPANFDVLRPNYEGEFRSRIDTLKFFVESYLLNGVPADGIPLPSP